MKFLRLIPTKFKVWLLDILYQDIASKGDEGDSELAHVNLWEANLLRAHGGSGTVNPTTGLREFKGGGSPAPTESTSYSSNLPEYAQPFYEELLKQSGKETYKTDSAGNVVGVQEFVPYTGDRLAEFTPEQLAIQTDVSGLTQPGQFATAGTGLTDTMSAAGTARGGIGSALGYAPGTFAEESITTEKFTDPGIAASYMDPYQQQVTDIQLAEARRQGDIAKSERGLGSIGRGTFGGGRQALMEGEADRNLAMQLGQIQAQGSQQGYQNAQQAFTADQGRNLQMQQANQAANLQAQQMAEQSQQFGTGTSKDIGLAGLQTGLQGAQAQAQLGATEQMANLERLKAQSASAGEQQALQQEIDNLAYQQFKEGQDYKKGLLEYQSNILRGTAGALGSTQVAYAPAPSMASQIGGMGLAGLGLYNMMGKG
tara:strand:+ start:444 stop:1724 length:1281 start_codon:yes stop_codon:yes gene_type:complete